MNDEDNPAREGELREKIASQMRSIGPAQKKPLPGEDLQKLKAAASRLDQMLRASADADRVVLQSAATRLDKLLRDLRRGKDVNTRLKRRPKTDDSQANQK